MLALFLFSTIGMFVTLLVADQVKNGPDSITADLGAGIGIVGQHAALRLKQVLIAALAILIGAPFVLALIHFL